MLSKKCIKNVDNRPLWRNLWASMWIVQDSEIPRAGGVQQSTDVGDVPVVHLRVSGQLRVLLLDRLMPGEVRQDPQAVVRREVTVARHLRPGPGAPTLIPASDTRAPCRVGTP